MNRVPGVSVVMATFNGERHVETQLLSISRQSVKPLEILVGDDGSTDRTVDLVRKFAADAAVPVHLSVNSERLGFAENFLRTASRARGSLMAFADQDDVWLPGRLAAATAALSSTEMSLWVSGWRMVDEDLVPLADRRLHTGFMERTTIANPLGVISGSRLVFRTDLFDHMPPDSRPVSLDGEGPAAHDEWACFSARILGKIAFTRLPLMLYRRHPGASTIANPAIASRAFMLRRGGEGSLAARHQAALERTAYLRSRLPVTDDGEAREKILAAAEIYERLAPRLARRADTLAKPLRTNRARSLTMNALRGDYGRLRRGGLGAWAFAQDLASLSR